MKLRIGSVLLLLAVVGCGGADDGETAPDGAADGPSVDAATTDAAAGDAASPHALTPEQIANLCEQSCAHRVACGEEPDQAACEADCVAEAPVGGWMRGDAALAVVACQVMQPCDNPIGDGCFAACQPLPEHEAFETQCVETMAPCWSTSQLQRTCSATHVPGVSDSGFFCLVVPEIMMELTACVADGTTCQDAEACVQRVLDQHGVQFG